MWCSPRFCSWSLTFYHVYTSPLGTLIFSLSLNHHLYADDTQIFFSFYAPDFPSNISYLFNVLQHISSWMTANLLTLNTSKTEFLLISTWLPSLSLNHYLYADDTQIFFSFYTPDFLSTITYLLNALQHISSWMTANLLTLNTSKTEFLLIWLKQQLAIQDTKLHSQYHSLCS